jgi:dTDP-4-dehydrorhamnose 3,5-epimerase
MSEPRAIDIPLHLDTRGWLMATDKVFEGMKVAYAYPTCCFPGVVKGWHRHKEHGDRMMCVSGTARVVVAHRRGDEHADAGALVTMWYETHEFIIGPLSPKVVVIPPGWWHGFQALGGRECIIINAPDMPYDPDDEERIDIDEIPFEWWEVSG